MRTLFVFSLLVVLTSCRATLDGGFEGSAACGGDAQAISAVLDEQDDGDLEGTAYVEVSTIVGKFIGRYDVDDGRYDSTEPRYPYTMVLRTVDGRRDFDVRMALKKDNPDVIEGEVDQIDSNGTKTGECDLTMDRVSVAGN
jgi:hypothetical protein